MASHFDGDDEIVGVLWRNPKRMGGVWCVLGTRIPLEAVLRDAIREPVLSTPPEKLPANKE